MSASWIPLAYLLASSLFILGLKRLSSPRTAPSGNRLAAVGMLIAVVATLLDQQIVRYEAIIAGAAVGAPPLRKDGKLTPHCSRKAIRVFSRATT